MSNRYNTDGMLVLPDDINGPKMNVLESIECAIAFDVRDWSASRRSAWIYAIVFEWDAEAWSDFRERYGWDEEDIARAKMYHEQWETLKTVAEGLLWRKEAQF